ncbi:MAG TPA: V-type ATP synthase subunit I [Thermoplasmatales archaeon]|nr:V-type ATP synthase subunit I [Thermoplasmatales archaeon]
MLFPAPVKKVSFIVHQSYLDKVITSLHESGLMQIIDITREDSKLLNEIENCEPSEETNECIAYENRLKNLIGILKTYKISKSGLKALLSPSVIEKKPVKKKKLSTLYREIDSLLRHIEKKILSLDGNIQKLKSEIDDINEDLQNISYLLNFDFDISYLGDSEYVITKAGITSEPEMVSREIESLDGIAGYVQIGKRKEKKWCIVGACHVSKKDKLELIWQRHINDIYLPSMTGKPLQVYKALQKQRDKLTKEMKKLKKEMNELSAEYMHELLVKLEEIQIERVRREISSSFGKTSATYVIEGWVLERDSNTLKSLLEKVTDEKIAISTSSPSSNPDNPPTYLDIPPWMEPFKTILALFSIPKYNEISPVPFLVIWFPLLFGIMLGDAGYGIVILLISLLAKFKLGSISPFIRSWSLVGILFGFWAVLFGFLFNSFFGDFVPRFIYGDENALLYHLDFLGYSIPLDALHKPLIVLVIALLIGLVHLNLGFVLAMCQNYRRGETKKIFKEQIPWFLLEIGGGALVGKALLHIWDLSLPMFIVSSIFAAIGLIALFVNNKAMGFFELTGFVGDWLSYARLLALGLATSGMALAFNIIAQLMPEIVPYIGIVLLFVILIFAHLANLLIQSLGAAIHSLRLQYVEFFNRFYEGGGKEFTPFRVRRKYTEEIVEGGR